MWSSEAQVLFALSAVVTVLAVYYLRYSFSYWQRRGVVSVPRPLPLVGNMLRVFAMREHTSAFFVRVYNAFPQLRFVGFYQGQTPALMIRDPELVKTILIKDFNYFVDHGMTFSEKIEPLLARNLFNMEGQRWREMRAKLTPTFTSGRMRAMFPLVQESAQSLEEYLGRAADERKDIDFKDLMARYTTTVIASAVFGISCDAILDPEAKFRIMSRKIVETDFIQGIKVAASVFVPNIAAALGMTFFKKECEPYFRSLVHEIIETRAAAAKSGDPPRRDFMELLLELKNKGHLEAPEGEDTKIEDKIKFTEDDVLAQAMVFFFAGFDTSALALTHALFELSRRPELQRKVRVHIEEVLTKHEGHVTYQALQDMTYLDCILNETLRKHPSLGALFRVCTQRYRVPDSDLTLEVGTPVIVPINALHTDPQLYPEPEVFNPDRFIDPENKELLLSFGEGPRQCIGLRFAKMLDKLGLLASLRSLEFHPSPLTPGPLTVDPRLWFATPRDPVYARVSRVTEN